MRVAKKCVALVAMLLIPIAASSATTLIHNIKGYSMRDGERVSFTALEYADGKVTAIYSSEAAMAASQAGNRIDGGGATLLPGLIDAHGHVSSYAQALTSVDMTGTTSEDEAAARIAGFLEASPDAGSGWIRGNGWNQVLWDSGEFPDRASLDSVTGERPAAFSRVDGHALWVNSAALRAAGIDRNTPDPDGGQILRDADGEPTGVLIDNAMSAIRAAIGQPSVDEFEDRLELGLTALAALGLTGVHDAGISAREMQAYRNLQAQGRLPIRVYAMLSVRDPANDATLEQGPWTAADAMLSVRSVKILADGALGSRGAALHEDYSDQPGHRGLLVLDADSLRHHMQRSVASGFQANVHAIGDRANTLVLDEFERLNQEPASRSLRHRIEHAQILRPTDIGRFKALDVIASVQPTHATSDKNMAGDRLGEERLEGAYAWQTLFESGARLAGGSDFPVEPAEPFFGLHAAVTRQDRNGEPPGGWRVGEALSRNQALSLFTEDAAYAGHAEESLGRLEPGYAADYVLVQDDFFAVSRDQLWQNRVLATVVAGKPVYAAEDSPRLAK
jgi:predicted amidohydrolase YtcJ